MRHATERARFLRDAIDGALQMRMVFPDLKAAMPWGASSFTIQRPANAIGPSVTAYGVGAGSTGTRADLLVCDDVVDVRSLHNKNERGRVADYFENNLMNLLEPDGRPRSFSSSRMPRSSASRICSCGMRGMGRA